MPKTYLPTNAKRTYLPTNAKITYLPTNVKNLPSPKELLSYLR